VKYVMTTSLKLRRILNDYDERVDHESSIAKPVLTSPKKSVFPTGLASVTTATINTKTQMKTVSFANENQVQLIESLSEYSYTERQDTWYNRDEIDIIHDTVKKIIKQQQLLSYNLAYYNSANQSFDFSRMTSSSGEKTYNIVQKIVKMQQKRGNKWWQKKNVKSLEDVMSAKYSELAKFAKQRAHGFGKSDAEDADQIYISDGLIMFSPSFKKNMVTIRNSPDNMIIRS